MGLSLYNTATHSKDLFEPLASDTVGMYVCGPTVYDLAHIGNARPAVVFDVLYRLLKRQYKNVTYVRNITDVDDKIIDAAKRNDETIESVTARTAKAYHEDMAELGAMPPDIEPRATAHLPQMIETIQELIGLGKAYEAEGHVLFAVAEYADYGKLSRRNRDEMLAGARVEVAPYKRDGADFVLWKPSTEEQPGWDSPWGRGRPGWHIECSAMSDALLGAHFDIHGGGNDLMFPHHENEIAQSCCAHPGAGFANVWLHNEMLQVEGKKMSKSLGNFFTVRDLLDQGVPGEVIRFVFLSTHYRKPMDWTADKAREAEKVLRKWRAMVEGVEAGPVPQAVLEAVADDLNTAGALAELHRLAGAGDAAGLKAGAGLLGLLGPDLAGWDKAAEGVDLSAWAERLTAVRAEAMQTKDFAEVDRLKSALVAAGVEVRMSKAGVELVAGPGFDGAALEGIG